MAFAIDGNVSEATFAVKGVIIELLDLNLHIASKVRAFDCSFMAFGLMIHQLVEMLLNLATKLLVFAGMVNFLNHLVDDGVCSVSCHRSSASWTRMIHKLSALFTNNVSSGAGLYRTFPGDEETHGALEFTQ